MHRPTAFTLAALLALAACSGADDGADDAAEPTTTTVAESTSTTAAIEPLTILVTNDDGIGAPGIDLLVTGLMALEDVEVVVVAPAENQSGSSDKTTPGGAAYGDGTTASGVGGTAVQGFPADSVDVALDDLGLEPDLVVSGVNQGQNVGPLAFESGTVGAARTAGRRGIPAVAASAGFGETADYPAAVTLVVAWVEENRDALAAGTAPVDTVTSFNVPTCVTGTMQEDVIEVPLAATISEGVDPFNSDCTVVLGDPPADDVAAIVAGYATQTAVPLEAP